jgi:uncharacterized protein (TIGR00730 family)
MRRICVYCGAKLGANPEYAHAARRLGTLLARRQITLIFGGGNVGLMGAMADALLAEQGQAVGVIPRFFVEKGLQHAGIKDMRLVDTMHERKSLMAQMADGFIALPGGLGTIEELLEILTWSQIGLHRKPVGLLNVAHFFGPLLALLDQMVQEQFLKPLDTEMLLVEDSPDRLLERFQAF